MTLKVPGNWWREFFDNAYLKIYRTEDLLKAPREVEGIVEILNLPTGSKILDLCCGYGRHSIPLARRGYMMTGLDLSDVLLSKAKNDSKKEGVEVKWIEGDMRDIPLENEFDGAINIFTAFGYFKEDSENEKVIHSVFRSLKRGGKFLLETINREWIIRNFQEKDWEILSGKTVALDERELDLEKSRSRARTLILGKEKRSERSLSLRLYTLTEMISILNQAGLNVKSVYGGLDGSEYSLNSKRMVILAEKGRSHARR
jgi:SAM-dependent methyltransferase